ncbi:hypothetical protein E1301_Tti021110 [Triplophysa tibetana]|uniref:Uncharacterized protein n=1 Tax=Triplophysa tibetana TaxID=1572043 RepID=A0A5A9NF23_9TELE|nr:hypothetical protein E1301_Tti021110 [Triplophysa tibetana]
MRKVSDPIQRSHKTRSCSGAIVQSVHSKAASPPSRTQMPLLLSLTSQNPYKLNQDTKNPAACLGRTDQPGLKLKEAMERFCDTQHNFNGAEEAGKKVVISSAARPVCLPMMSPPHYNEMRRRRWAVPRLQKETGVEAKQEVTPVSTHCYSGHEGPKRVS